MKKTNKILLLLLFPLTGILNAQNFERVSNIDLKSGYNGYASWCDYNSDGYLDIFVTGMDFSNRFKNAEIYKNNGNKTFTLTNITLMPRVIYGDISWGDYDNNGTLDLIYAGTKSGFSENNITKIYKNLGNDKFIEISHNLPKLAQCNLEWIDVDNDGLLDIYYQGINSQKEFDLGVFKNLGNSKFEKKDINIDKITGNRGNAGKNSAKWADFDKDGLKDVIIAMSSRDGFKLEFYKNNGNFDFKKVYIGLPRLNYVQMDVGDVNQDGTIDIVFSGSTKSNLTSIDRYADIYIYTNNGNLNFTNSYKLNNVGVFTNTLELGDFSNDGHLDILYYGTGPYHKDLKIYKNNGNGIFSSFSHSIPGLRSGGAYFGDFDNDNDLDILNTGRISESQDDEVLYIYENKSNISNNKPTAPKTSNIWFSNNDVTIEWENGKDDITNKKSLSYNLNLIVKDSFLIRSNSNNEKLSTIKMGNMNLNKKLSYKSLSEGNYKIELQSIDNSYNTSSFSEKKEFCFKKTMSVLKDTLFLKEGDSLKLNLPSKFLHYKWNTGSNDSIIYVKKVGAYNVNLTHQDGCISSETTYVKLASDEQLSIANFGLENTPVIIYPIPILDKLNIKFQIKIYNPIHIEIFNNLGKLLYQTKIETPDLLNTISLPRFSKGIYYLYLKNESNKVYSFTKLIK